MKKIKIGLIGCGTIGSSLAGFVVRDLCAQAALAYLCDLDPEKAQRLKQRLIGAWPHRGQAAPKIVSPPVLIRCSDLIIEAASSQISGKVAEDALRLGKKVLIMSVGGLIQDSRWRRYLKVGAGLKPAPTIFVPSGALAGIDALLAAREGKIRSVRLITRKPLQSLNGAPYFKKHPFPKLKKNKARRIFKGSAVQAVKAFPQNINVAAVLSLAGLGPRKTQVEIWTSKRYHRNEHEVRIEGDAGSIRTLTSNVPSPENPKTSRLAILSAQAVLRKIFSSIKIGT